MAQYAYVLHHFFSHKKEPILKALQLVSAYAIGKKERERERERKEEKRKKKQPTKMVQFKWTLSIFLFIVTSQGMFVHVISGREARAIFKSPKMLSGQSRTI